MRPFFWRIVLCITPVLLAGWITWYAYRNDGFKTGIDLSGGTILVYEIDTRKQAARAGEEGARVSDPQGDTNLLAEALKRRIDPTGTYDIRIRPAGTGGRVEIILPTGGEARVREAQQKWDDTLGEMRRLWKIKDLDVARGKTQELVDRIQTQVSRRIWETKVFNTPAAWKEFINQAEAKWPQLKLGVAANKRVVGVSANALLSDPVSVTGLVGLAGSPAPARPVATLPPLLAGARIDLHLRKLRPGDLPAFTRLVSAELEGVVPAGAVDGWVKEQAWNVLEDRIRQKWPGVTKEDLKGITPDSFPELIGRVEARGNLFAQAALDTLRPLLGPQPVRKALNPRQQIEEFIGGKLYKKNDRYVYEEGNYGPTPKQIEQSIGEVTGTAPGQARDLTVEEVQRIKELVARVGSLEFRILANQHDDKAAIKDAMDQINNPANKAELERAAVRGEPPDGPLMPDKTTLRKYDIELPNNNKSKVTYSWVELGPQERRQIGLDNAARSDAGSRKQIWDYMHSPLGRATQIPVEPNSSNTRLLLQGALFYGREVKDRNMPEEQKRKKQWEYFVLARNPEYDLTTGKQTPAISGDFLKGARRQLEGGQPAVSFWFTTEGGRLFGELTGKNVPSGSGGEESQIKRHLAIVLDGLVMSAPTINSRITTSGQITGSFTVKEVDSLVNILRSGALPATLKPQPVSETTIGATLGQDTIHDGIMAIVIAFGAVVVFMVAYYRFAGLVASVALFANLIITVGFMVFVHATFTLPGLAGLVLTMGMAVDANVLIYERLREERDRGASLVLAIRNGYDRAFPTIIDTHLTSIFTAIVLYIVGNDQLKGFGVSLAVGLIISLFTSLYMTRLLFDIWQAKGWLHKLSMGRLLSKTDIDFMGIRYYWFTFTVVFSILGVAVFVARLPGDLNIDFVGGTAYTGQLTKAQDMTELRKLLGEQQQKEMLDVVGVKLEDTEGRKFLITYADPGGGTDRREVILANAAPGDTKAAREENVKERASTLPDLSVEQIFPSFLPTAMREKGESTFFNVRTSEKETELVQTALDRLLREKQGGKWEPLMKKIAMHFSPGELASRRKEVRLTFTEFGKDRPDFASQSFVQTLFTREVLQAFGAKDKKDLPFQFELAGSGKSEEGGRFQEMRLSFTPDLKDDEVPKVLEALRRTQAAYQARPAPERLENFDSELAAQVRLQAMWAILASWVAVVLYLWFRFGSWTFGLAAVLCQVHDLLFTLGIIAFCHYLHGTWFGNVLGLEDFKIDLTCVAALLTLVGYSVSDTIVVFDRIREVRGKNPDLTPEMINDSVNQTLSRTLLTAFTVWLVVLILYVLGGPGVHLFAFVMVVGVIVGTYSSIYVASPLLLIFGEGSRARTAHLPRPQPAGAPG
jgi:SecD/SecF fusion protein